jgi:cell filamentation protein
VASQFDSWESYFYPDTIDPLTGIGTLRNLYDERDARVLSRMEYTDTTVRAVQLGNGEVDVPRTFDGAHLRAIHGHLFQDVYEWAGSTAPWKCRRVQGAASVRSRRARSTGICRMPASS